MAEKKITTFSVFKCFKMFKWLYGTAGGGVNPNICLSVEYDGSKYYGYVYTTMGSADPDHANDGTLLYSFIWDNAGNFIVRWGDSGDEKVANAESIFIWSVEANKGREAQWGAAEEYYTFFDEALADKLIAEFNAGATDFCFHMSIQDGLVIDYNYDNILTGSDSYFSRVYCSSGKVLHITWLAVEADDATYRILVEGNVEYEGTDLEHYYSPGGGAGEYQIQLQVLDGDMNVKYIDTTVGVAT